MKRIATVLLLGMLIITGCGVKLPSLEVYPAEVGLKLKTGEACRYTYKDDKYDLNFLFAVISSNGASFADVNIKTPENHITSGGTALNGGSIIVERSDVKLGINGSSAQVCVEKKRPPIRAGSYGNFYSMGKCFTATRNPDGSWSIKNLPF